MNDNRCAVRLCPSAVRKQLNVGSYSQYVRQAAPLLVLGAVVLVGAVQHYSLVLFVHASQSFVKLKPTFLAPLSFGSDETRACSKLSSNQSDLICLGKALITLQVSPFMDTPNVLMMVYPHGQTTCC